jgi:hypothetical protein
MAIIFLANTARLAIAFSIALFAFPKKSSIFMPKDRLHIANLFNKHLKKCLGNQVIKSRIQSDRTFGFLELGFLYWRSI